MDADYDGRQVVGIDLHRRRSVIVRMTEAGERLAAVRIDNDPMTLAAAIAEAGENPDVVLEATYGWYWAVHELRELVRHRAKLVCWRSGLKASVHAVLAKQGLHIRVSDLFGLGGRELLATTPLDGPYRARIDACCRLIDGPPSRRPRRSPPPPAG